ncbi:MAG: translation initiation factor IF-3 [Firmicutes bacterium]|nr:translation initiation factor IF-3 [Bacillota bacterium]
MQINNQIKASELRVISEDNEQLGVMSYSQAMRLADEKELDLVLISPTANPPVARITDYGKFKFDAIRREKEQKKASKQAKIKEIQLSLNIQENEVAFKMKAARGFIEDGNKVKVAINRIRGRATMNIDKGIATLTKVAADFADIADLETPPTKGGVPGRNMNIIMILAPKKKK